MTIVEFFDIASLENICSTLLCRPDKVVLIGHSNSRLKHTIALYTDVARSKGINTEFFGVKVSRNNLNAIVDKLEDVVRNNPEDCIFDLTGGDDLYLVAVGIIMERYRGRVQCHRFNFTSEQLYDCDSDGSVLEAKSLKISVADNVAIYDGKIIYEGDGDFFTYRWDFNADFINDVKLMWQICAKNPRLWNIQIGTIGGVCDYLEMPSELEVSYDRHEAEEILRENRIKYSCVPWILNDLKKKGLIRALTVDENISFEFKNEQVKKCLTISGQILELYVAITLLAIKDEDGEPLYNDVKVGTVINWGHEQFDDTSTVNEVDVIAMKGAIPIFISCKNGFFDANELYKLSAVADKFGNKYAKKVLVTTEFDRLGDLADFLSSRMIDMEIRCISDVDQMPEGEFERILTSLWKN